MKKPAGRRLSATSVMHYYKLVFRSVLFLAVLILYLFHCADIKDLWPGMLDRHPMILNLIWVCFALEMFARFFPSRIESKGCQKQFRRNYTPIEGSDVKTCRVSWKVTFAMTAAWLALNGLIGALFLLGIIDEGVLLLVALAYSICDMVCILFFCPFQSWFMKNKCCGTCRIYNWDFAMMFTPFIFVPHAYTWSLLGMALLLLVQWEYLYHRYPERFYSQTNGSLSCENCKEKLCHHKKQLRRLWQHLK